MIGRSKIVGTPVSEILKWHHATVTVCHSKTKNLEDMVKQADILVVAIGKTNILENIIHTGYWRLLLLNGIFSGQAEKICGSWIKPGAVVIDCGINAIDDSTKKAGNIMFTILFIYHQVI